MAGVRDIARVAGVSTATVSRVLSGTASVSSVVQQRVRAAAAALNYRPELARRGRPSKAVVEAASTDFVVKGPGGSIALYVPCHHATAIYDRSTGYFAYVFSGMLRKAQEVGLSLNLTPYDVEQWEGILEAQRIGEARRAGLVGMVFLFSNQGEDQDLLKAGLEVPWVALNRGLAGAPVVVRTDERRGAYLATRHLLDLGHRVVGVLAGPSRFRFFEERLAGVRQAMQEQGLELAPRHVARAELSVAGGAESARTLLALPDRPTALFATEEDYAAGAVEEAERQGLRIPRDLSLVAFSDFVLSARKGKAMTAVRSPAYEMGYLALEALYNHARLNVEMRTELVLQTSLVVRDSTARPAGAAQR